MPKSEAYMRYYAKNREELKIKMMENYQKKRQEMLERKESDPEFCKQLKEHYREKNEKHKHTVVKKSIEELIVSPLTNNTKKEMLRGLIASEAYKALTPKNLKGLAQL